MYVFAKDDNPLDNPFVIRYKTVLGETRKILVTDIESDGLFVLNGYW